MPEAVHEFRHTNVEQSAAHPFGLFCCRFQKTSNDSQAEVPKTAAFTFSLSPHLYLVTLTPSGGTST